MENFKCKCEGASCPDNSTKARKQAFRTKTEKHACEFKKGRSETTLVCVCGKFKNIGEPVVQQTHTPTPWTQFITGKQYHVGICQAKSAREIAIVLNQKEYVEADNNAEFIIRAVNSHEDLIQTLANALHELRGLNANEFVIKQCEEAIDKGTGKTYQQRVTETKWSRTTSKHIMKSCKKCGTLRSKNEKCLICAKEKHHG